ncbi:MAG: 50S ribosomal protein L25 [Candidatus Brocadiaceae bacterium]|nr:50S ribosomal protein L25 [Candidatus Brocadiaceae bacterium]
MEILELNAEKRVLKKSRAAKKMRASGQIPAVLYGQNRESIMLCLKEDEFGRVLHSGSRMIRLAFGGIKETALMKEVQYHSLTDQVLHVDFSRIILEERVRLKVPILVFGEPVGVKDGGVLTPVMKEIEVECLPVDMPEKIKVNISELGLDKAIHVKELPALKGVRYLPDGDAVVVSIHRAVEEKIVSEEELLAGPEIISRRPKEESEETT